LFRKRLLSRANRSGYLIPYKAVATVILELLDRFIKLRTKQGRCFSLLKVFEKCSSAGNRLHCWLFYPQPPARPLASVSDQK